MRLTTNDNICEPAKPDATDWKSIKWYKVNRHVDSLQKYIVLVKIMILLFYWINAYLSLLYRKVHDRFLGEKGGVILPTYPTLLGCFLYIVFGVYKNINIIDELLYIVLYDC